MVLEKNKEFKEWLQNSKFVLKSKQRFGSEQYAFTAEVNNITQHVAKTGAKTDERVQSIDSIEIYAYGTSKQLVCKKEDFICNILFKNTVND